MTAFSHLLQLLMMLSGWWLPALAGYTYHFPADYGAHERARSEWWYYTGNVVGADHRRYGYELTIFRFGVQPPLRGGSEFDVDDLYAAHFAISDISGGRFYYFDRAGRAALQGAGSSAGNERTWVGAWTAARSADAAHRLRASQGGVALNLVLVPRKGPVFHGQNGISRKGACATCASHYYSFTRLQTSGVVILPGRRVAVSGWSWNDHEWGSDELQAGVVGWDWFSIQLSDNTELMLYRLRRSNGSVIPQSSGTLVYDRGRSRYVSAGDVSVWATQTWRSTASGARYPAAWHIRIARYRADLSVTPLLADQELRTNHSTHATYWEGACIIAGSFQGHPVNGYGYTELTGYAPNQPGGPARGP